MSIINNPLLLGGSGGSGGGGGGGGSGGGGGTPVTEAWAAKLADSNTSDYGSGVAVDTAGNVYVSGFVAALGVTIAKYDSKGVLQWQRKHGAANGQTANCAVDASGNVYVLTGLTSSSTNIYLIKYDSSGTFQWEFRIGTTLSWAGRVALDSSGNPYIFSTAGANNNAHLIKVNTSGTLQWQRSMGAPNEEARGFGIDSSDNIIVYYGGYNASYLAKYNTSGVQQWRRSLSGTVGSDGIRIAVSNSGDIVIGHRDVSSNVMLAKLDSSGAVVWQKSYSTVILNPDAFAFDANSNIYAAFLTSSSRQVLIKYDTNGTQLSAKILPLVKGIATSGNFYYIAGAIGTSNGGSDMVVLKLDSDGREYNTFGPYTNSTTTYRIEPCIISASSYSVTSTATTVSDSAGALTVGSGTSYTSSTTTYASQTINLTVIGTVSSADVGSVFSTYLYTGTGVVTGQFVPNGINTTSNDTLVWAKSRGSSGHYLADTKRGFGYLSTDSANGQSAHPFLGFSSSGIIAASSANTNNGSYVSWTFRKAPKFFDVVTYTGTGANRTIAHNLGSVPGCIIVKRTDTTGDWQVYHRSLANTEYMVLNSTAAKATGTTRWNSTTPTSTEFSLGTDATVNASGGTYVAYLFAHDAGGFGDSGTDSVIQCGGFNHAAGANTAVNLGWEPQFIIARPSNTTVSWYILDSLRGWTANHTAQLLYANNPNPEDAGSSHIGLTSAGFSLDLGWPTGTWIYIAIRRGPMVKPTDATKVFNSIIYNGSGVANTAVNTGFTTDLVLSRPRTVASIQLGAYDRLRGSTQLLRFGAEFNAELSQSGTGLGIQGFDQNNGYRLGADQAYGHTNINGWGSYINYAFARAPGFFDIVCYSGTSVNRTIAHNLAAAPELVFIRGRSSAYPLIIYYGDSTKYLQSDSSAPPAAPVTDPTCWNNTAPTSSVFSVGTHVHVNYASVNFVAYLFASLPGVSKVGTYTGTGTTNQINCGFIAGARFVFIRRIDAGGNGYIYDATRGIIAANDPYVLLNSGDVEITNTDYIDPLASGFEISSTAPVGINANGGTYFYFAIA